MLGITNIYTTLYYIFLQYLHGGRTTYMYISAAFEHPMEREQYLSKHHQRRKIK